MELIDARKKFFVAKRAKEQRSKPPTQAEQRKRMCTYMKHMVVYKDKDFKGMNFDAESSKKLNMDEVSETTKLKLLMKVVQDEEIAIDAIPLATKPPTIVD
ncbi:hypothetical protein Tco_1531517 [Tanacetum coccineum]